jgi:hypothetical protein
MFKTNGEKFVKRNITVPYPGSTNLKAEIEGNSNKRYE